jgi:hypothetical protein
MLYVNLGKGLHKAQHAVLVGMNGLTRDVDQEGKEQVIPAKGDIVLNVVHR